MNLSSQEFLLLAASSPSEPSMKPTKRLAGFPLLTFIEQELLNDIYIFNSDLLIRVHNKLVHFIRLKVVIFFNYAEPQMAGHDLLKAIEIETSGDYMRALITIGRYITTLTDIPPENYLSAHYASQSKRLSTKMNVLRTYCTTAWPARELTTTIWFELLWLILRSAL